MCCRKSNDLVGEEAKWRANSAITGSEQGFKRYQRIAKINAVQDKIKNQMRKLSIQMLRAGITSKPSLYAAAKGQFQRDWCENPAETIV